MARAHYLYVLLFISACAVFVTALFRIRTPGFWRSFFITDCAVLTVYLAWDFWAVTRGSWSFDPNQILGIVILNKLPIEEILFFIIVPLMTVLTYLALAKLTGWSAKER
jgi:lycopene cyclase domain-containing protein